LNDDAAQNSSWFGTAEARLAAVLSEPGILSPVQLWTACKPLQTA